MTTQADQETAVRQDAWEGFTPGAWTDSIDPRDFIMANYTPYEGDASFLEGATAKTLNVWDTLQRDYLSVERARRIYDIDTHTPADIDAFPAGYICSDDDVIVGLQTDVPLKRAMMPNGGWRMVETAIKEAGMEVDDVVQEAYAELAGLADVTAIRSPRAYLFTTARSVILQQLRRARIVSFETVADLDRLVVDEATPGPERQAVVGEELRWLAAVIDALPGKCRQAFVLRKLHGLSQRAIAAR